MIVWQKPKRFFRMALACLCSLCALPVLFPAGLFGVVSAATTAPEYMLKMDMSKEAELNAERPLFTSVSGLEDGTYVFSFDYYNTSTVASGAFYAATWSFWNLDKQADGGTIGSGNGSIRMTRTFTNDSRSNGRMTVGIDQHGQMSGGVFYAWNFKLVKEGGDGTNLLANPDFKNGSLKDWNYAFSGWFEQDANPDPNGVCSAVEYDETLIGLDDGKTYMLKMDMDRAISSGQSWTELNVSDYAGTDIPGEEIPGTYTFSYDYYVSYSEDTGMLQNRISTGGTVVDYGTLPQGRGTVSRTFTVTADSPSFWVGFMSAESKGGVAYFWNLKLVKEGSDENRLLNKSLRKGTLKGWRYVNQYGYIPDDATEKEYFSVVEYSNALTTMTSLGASYRSGTNPGVRFGFTVANVGVAYATACAEGESRTDYTRNLTNATVRVDGVNRRILDMGALVSTDEAAVTGHTARSFAARNLYAVENGVVTFTMVVTGIPESENQVTLYACPYVQYATQEGSAFLYGTVLSDVYTTGGSLTASVSRTGYSNLSAAAMREQIVSLADTAPTGGTTYYISPYGDDANSGDSPEQAWKTLAAYAANGSRFREGDSLLLERNGVYRGSVYLRSGMLYGAYGEGEKPRIYGSPRSYSEPGDWLPTDRTNVWRCAETFPQDVGSIFFDGGRRAGIKKLHTPDALQQNYDFYHDPEDGSLYLYLEQNPTAVHRDIELGVASCILAGGASAQDIVIENLCLQYCGAHAIAFDNGARNITVRGCVIGWIGGCLQNPGVNDVRFGNGIQFWNACSDILIEDCWVYQIYDAGLTHQGSSGRVENVTYRRNLVEYCVYGFELFLGGSEGMHHILYEDRRNPTHPLRKTSTAAAHRRRRSIPLRSNGRPYTGPYRLRRPGEWQRQAGCHRWFRRRRTAAASMAR